MPDTSDLSLTIFAKTALGQQEIQTRSLGLSPLVRRTLVLVDGKRPGAELSTFLVGKGDIVAILGELQDLGCIEAVGRSAGGPAAAPAEPPASGSDPADSPATAGDHIEGLPPAETRTAKENEMARNFMINSINAIIGQNMRVTLITEIYHAQGTEGLRKVYRDWEASMSNHGAGSRRLPELREKLFKAL